MMKLEFDVDQFNVCIIVVLLFLLFLFNFFDVYYFVRLIGSIGYHMFFGKRLSLNDVSVNYGICTTHDLDFVLKHMNNARFLRELDFARVLFYVRTGAISIIRKKGGDILQSACSIRYRRTIPLFTTYKVTTKLIYWDDNAMYLEHEFISLKDGFVRAVVMSQQKVVKMSVVDMVKKLLNEDEPKAPSPPEELKPWMESMKISSEKLRNTTIKKD